MTHIPIILSKNKNNNINPVMGFTTFFVGRMLRLIYIYP